MNSPLKYYLDNFSALSSDKKFHFATRIKNWFKGQDDTLAHYFDDFFKNPENKPSSNLQKIYEDNDFSKVNEAGKRRPFFEKYDHLYSIEAMLFRVHHLLAEYDSDLRSDFLTIVPKSRLEDLTRGLLADDEALKILSTFAVNVVYLSGELFYDDDTDFVKLAEKSLGLDLSGSPLLAVYLYTHIILCDSDFYKQSLAHQDLMKKMLEKTAEIIHENYTKLSLDTKLEFLVCEQLIRGKDGKTSYEDIRLKIKTECEKNLETSPFLVDKTKPAEKNTLNGAEHRNVLYIMSGLN